MRGSSSMSPDGWCRPTARWRPSLRSRTLGGFVFCGVAMSFYQAQRLAHDVVAEGFFEAARAVECEALRAFTAADVTVFAVPCFGRAEGAEGADDDACDFDELLRVKVADVPFGVAHGVPDVAHFAGHEIRQGFEFGFSVAVGEAEEVGAKVDVFARGGFVFDDDVFVVAEVGAEDFAEVPGGEVVVVAGDDDDADGGDVQGFFDGLDGEVDAEAIDFGEAAVAILRGACGGGAGGVVGVELIVTEDDEDFFGPVRCAGEQGVVGGAVVGGGDLAVVVAPAGLAAVGEFAEVDVGDAEFVEVAAGFDAGRADEFLGDVSGDEFSELLDGVFCGGGLAAFEPHFYLVVRVGLIFLRAAALAGDRDFP